MRKLKLFVVSVIGILAAPFAQAAVPTEAATAVTDLIADAGTFVASLWPLVIAIVVGLLFIKLFKKGTSRAT